MTIKPRENSHKKKNAAVQKPESKNIKRFTTELTKSLPESLNQIVNNLEALSDLSLITDSKGNILQCSNPASHLICSKKIFVRKNFLFFVHSKVDNNKILIEAASQNNISFIFNLEISKNKTIPILSRWSSFIEKLSGERFYLILNYTLSSPHQSNDWGIINNITEEIAWSSSSGLKDRFTVLTGNLGAITGFSQAEIKRKPEGFLSIIYVEDYTGVIKSYEKFISDSKQKNIRMVYRVLKKDKKIAWMKEIVTLERNKTGIPKMARGIISDISDIMEIDQTLVKTIERLRNLNDSKDKFISTLSHDLRAPFTSILGFTEILISEEDLPIEEKQEYLSYIHDSSQNQLQLINYLLDWSRLQTGRIKFEPQRLLAQASIFNCISSLTGNAMRKNIEIKINVSDRIYVQADERLLIQVIMNLVSNAIKFSSENNIIAIEADIFDDEFIEFVVKDEGRGITDENKLKMFKIDKMFSTEGTKGEKGTGLGLLLAKEIVEKHKGSIWFYSEYGKGSEFHFTVPHSPNIILLVDNNANDKNIYEELIQENFPAYKVMSTSNGYEAMNIVLDKLPSLVVTENEMPLMNGIQLIEFIRREEKNYTVPIIISAGKLTDEVRGQYNNLGVLAIIQKPVNVEQFIEKLNKALDPQKYRSLTS